MTGNSASCQQAISSLTNSKKQWQTGNSMKKKVVRHTHRHHHIARHARPTENYLVMVRGWMLVVAFALMLGVGAIVGSYINGQLNASSPTVAGAQTSR